MRLLLILYFLAFWSLPRHASTYGNFMSAAVFNLVR